MRKHPLYLPLTGTILSLIGILLCFLLLPYETPAFISWIQLHTETLSSYVLHITYSGSPVTIFIAACILLILIHTGRDTDEEYVIVLAGLLTFAFVFLFKEITGIPRPEDALVFESGYRFPSGHTAGAFYLSSILFVTLWKSFKKKSSHVLFALVLCIYPLVIGLSRIYLGVHTPLDVVAGIFTALLALSVSYLILPFIIPTSHE